MEKWRIEFRTKLAGGVWTKWRVIRDKFISENEADEFIRNYPLTDGEVCHEFEKFVEQTES